MKKIGREWKSEYIYYKKKEGHYNYMWKTEHIDCHTVEKYFSRASMKMLEEQYRHWSIHHVYDFPTKSYSNPWGFYNGITPIIRRPLVNPLILCCLNTIYGYEQLHMARAFSIVFTEIL